MSYTPDTRGTWTNVAPVKVTAAPDRRVTVLIVLTVVNALMLLVTLACAAYSAYVLHAGVEALREFAERLGA